MIPTSAAPIRILMVDDHPASLAPLRHHLELAGHRVESVEGVLYAMWSVNASHRIYDLVLCAVELADGDTIELLTHLRKRMNVRTIALARRGVDPRALHRAAASPAIDRVLTHPAGALPGERICESVCAAVAELMSPARARDPGADPALRPPNVA